MTQRTGVGRSEPEKGSFAVARVAPSPLVRRVWGPEKEARGVAILDAIRRWTDRYGEPPRLADWEPSRARKQGQEWRAQRFERGDWPSARVVRSHFGTMSLAIRAAGLPARGGPCRTRRHLTSSETVLEALRAWHARYGESPTMTDWDPARARHEGQDWRVARYYEGDWPSIATVRHHFGTLNQAVRAAGLAPRAPGQHASPEPRRGGVAESEAWPRPQRMLALRVRAVAELARRDQPTLLIEALTDLVAAASSWADQIRAESSRGVGSDRVRDDDGLRASAAGRGS